jgi:hypothetical protein
MIIYTRKELKQLMLNHTNSSKLKKKIIFSIMKEEWFDQLEKEFCELKLPKDWSLQRKLWHWWYYTIEIPKCPISGLERKWRGGRSTEMLELNGSSEGYSTFANIKVSRSQAGETSKNAVIKKYGVENVFQLESTKQKSKETILERYGVENISKSDETKKKKEKTMLERHGIKHNFEKAEEYMFIKHGVRNPSHIPDIAEILCTNRFKSRKEYFLETGEMILLQGYENFGFDFLKLQFKEEEISYKKKDVPKIYYVLENRERRYYSDFYVNKNNLVVEVKSKYTYKKDFEVLKLKYNSTINFGYKFLLLIFSDSGELLHQSDNIPEHYTEI